MAALVAHRAVRCTAPDREVASGNHRPAAVQARQTDDHIGGPYIDEFVAVVRGSARELPDFPERAGVGQQLDTLPDGELAAPSLLGDAGFSTHLFGERAPPLEFVYFGLPDHVSCPR